MFVWLIVVVQLSETQELRVISCDFDAAAQLQSLAEASAAATDCKVPIHPF
jgi:hypothetical protein